MKIAYCDCFSGISGDMFLGALLDAGLPLGYLNEQVAALRLVEHVTLSVDQVHKGALRAAQLEVHVESTHPSDHRHFTDIVQLIESSSLSPKAKSTSIAIFDMLAQAEARVHGSAVEEVHFHEVGAVDSIVDIVGAAAGLEYLGVEQLFASALPMVSGQVQTQHGTLPLPAPATLELMGMTRMPVVPSPAQVELVTPTGAAILATLATFEQPAMTVSRTGIGAGRREMPWPNVLRVILGESEVISSSGLVQIETNIDDMNPQVFGYVMGKLFAAGALDVFFTPIQMKKNRPATMLSVIARRTDEATLAQLILQETSTLGVRVLPLIHRYETQREMRAVQTEYGEVPVKLKYVDGKVTQAAPEHDVCARLAAERGVTLMAVYTAALAAARVFVTAETPGVSETPGV
ncbi:MAG: nickel pincer cofactor biosynthesis protein LarC [Chloroflexi bacterium]|nr:nickel pincer cofactor biosynthesis protein LarC [Chloroflexota bacterium]